MHRHLSLFLFIVRFSSFDSERVSIKQCPSDLNTVREANCDWSCQRGDPASDKVLVCHVDGVSLLRCQTNGDCISHKHTKLRFGSCEPVSCHAVEGSCANNATNGEGWTPQASSVGACSAHVSEWNALLMLKSGGGAPDRNASSWKCWSIIWAMGTFAVACFVLQCAAFNMYKSRRKRTVRHGSDPGTADSGDPFGGPRGTQQQQVVLPSAPPLVHSPVRAEANNFQLFSNQLLPQGEPIQPQVVYISDRPPAYEVVLQLSDHPPPYSSL